MAINRVRITSYVGKKDKFLEIYNECRPRGKILKTWECCAGTLSMSINLLLGLEPHEMYATEKDKGMFSLLHAIKETPFELYEVMEDVEYSMENYKWATKQRDNQYSGLDELQIAKAKYILCNMSFNGIDGKGMYRDIDKGAEEDLEKYVYAKQVRERFRRQLFANIMRGSKRLQDIQIRNGDMMDEFDEKAADEEMFIFADIPYTNGTRKSNIYSEDTNLEWHKNFVNRIISLQKSGKLKASIMICNYCQKELKDDLYCELLKYGFVLIDVKEVSRPTVIRNSSEGKMKRNKVTEYIFINYEPACSISEDRIITKEDVFGK